jgi:carbon-monoxide dehydrogenase medium subunit
VRPHDLQETVQALARYGGEGKVLAGGQSLIPLLKLRFAVPSVLIDINRIGGLESVPEPGSRCWQPIAQSETTHR